MDGSSGPEIKVHRGTATNVRLHCFARRGAYVSATSQYTPLAPQFLSGKRTAFVLRRCIRPREEYQDWRAGTAALRRARFQAVCVAQAGSVKMAFPRPGRAPGWCPIPPGRACRDHQHLAEACGAYPLQGATQTPAVERLAQRSTEDCET